MASGPRGRELLQGEIVTLAASAARTASASGDWVYVGGERLAVCIVLDITASATAAGDTLDVFIDASFDGTNSIANIAHFTQQAGNGSAARYYAMIAPGFDTVTTTITSDAAAGVVRGTVIAPYYRARWALVDGGGADTSHTFSVVGYGV